MTNIALLEQVMQHIEDHPDQHDQSVWVNECGTAACFAGWTCLLSGWQPTFDRSRSSTSVPSRARGLLELEYADSKTLFGFNNTRAMLRLMVKDLVNGEPLREQHEYLIEAGDVA